MRLLLLISDVVFVIGVKVKDDDDELVEEEQTGDQDNLATQDTVEVNDEDLIENEEESNDRSLSSTNLSSESKEDAMNASTTTLNDVMDDTVAIINDSEKDEKLVVLESQLHEISEKNESLKAANGAMNTELNEAQQQLCEALKLLDEKCRLLEELEVQKLALVANSSNKSKAFDDDDAAKAPVVGDDEVVNDDENNVNEIAKLKEDNEKVSAENQTLKSELASQLKVIEDLEQKQMAWSSASTLVGSSIIANNPNNEKLEQSLNEAQAKISELLKVKEKYAEVSAEKSALAMNMSEMKEEMNLLTMQTKTATACALIPIAVVIFAVMMSYFPSIF